jgi:aminoglycoside/choline kinase family phosphotransferase
MKRQQAIESWLAGIWPGRAFTMAPASADASFRRYFRVSLDDGSTRIVMDAPPTHEDVRPWLKVQGLFHAAGVHVPDVLAEDLAQGFLLLSDLGNTTYLAALSADPGRADVLYRQSIDALIRIQAASRTGELPDYDRALLKRELDLFPEWYVAKHLGVTLNDAERSQLEQVFDRILAINLAEPKVYVHRDWHSRNLMTSEPNPGIVDFQDAVYGPISYDMVSLLKDAYIEWTEEMRSTGSSPTGSGRARPACPSARTLPSSTATLNGWAYSVISKYSASSPASTIGTARTATSRTCRWSPNTCAPPAPAMPNSAPSAKYSTCSKTR